VKREEILLSMANAGRATDQGTEPTNRVPSPEGSKRKRIQVFGRPLGFQHWTVLPLFLFFLLFLFYPVFELVRMAFSTVQTSGGEFIWDFSGLDNFRTMLGDETFWAALRNTVIFITVTVAIQLVLGTTLAVLVEKARLLSGLVRTLLVWPVVITPVAVSIIWFLILDIELGVLNHALDWIGLPQQRWLASTTWALPALMLVDVWHWTPIVFLIVLAGLASIDQSLYEAARVDGASEWKMFWYITLPLLVPTLLAAAVIRMVLGTHVFGEIYLLTGGGPGTSTEVLSTYIHQVFIDQGEMGYGAFLGLIIVAIFATMFAIYYLYTALRGRRKP
jgi:multiple sugar transport system permease protein